MNKQGFRGVMLLLLFIWAGMILGISFLEAPLKFHAPKVTLAIGVGIGRLVFGTLNKIEIVYCFSLIVLSFVTRLPVRLCYFLGLIALVLMVQTFWLLPALDARAQILIDGGIPADRSPHLFYVLCEIIKLVTLIIVGLKLFGESVKLAAERE